MADFIVHFNPENEKLPLEFEQIDHSSDLDFGGFTHILYDVPIATRDSIGAVKVGDRLSIEKDGTISASKQVMEVLTNEDIEKLLGGAGD